MNIDLWLFLLIDNEFDFKITLRISFAAMDTEIESIYGKWFNPL